MYNLYGIINVKASLFAFLKMHSPKQSTLIPDFLLPDIRFTNTVLLCASIVLYKIHNHNG